MVTHPFCVNVCFPILAWRTTWSVEAQVMFLKMDWQRNNSLLLVMVLLTSKWWHFWLLLQQFSLPYYTLTAVGQIYVSGLYCMYTFALTETCERYAMSSIKCLVRWVMTHLLGFYIEDYNEWCSFQGWLWVVSPTLKVLCSVCVCARADMSVC